MFATIEWFVLCPGETLIHMHASRIDIFSQWAVYLSYAFLYVFWLVPRSIDNYWPLWEGKIIYFLLPLPPPSIWLGGNQPHGVRRIEIRQHCRLSRPQPPIKSEVKSEKNRYLWNYQITSNPLIVMILKTDPYSTGNQSVKHPATREHLW